MKKVIFVSGPFRAETAWEIEQNVRRVEVVTLEISRMGAIALAPHLLTRYFQDELPDEFWMTGAIELLKRSDAIFMVPGWESSIGSLAERQIALDRGMPVFENFKRLEEWLRIDCAEAAP